MVMAKEITEIDDSSHANKKAIAQIRRGTKGWLILIIQRFLMPSTKR